MSYIVTQNVDYLSFTLATPRDFFGDTKYDNIKSPNARYDSCIINQSGAVHMWHSQQPRMKHHYIYSGKSLEYMRQHGIDEREMVKWCLEKSSISRIDIALTSQPDTETGKHAFTPHMLAWAVRDNMLKSRLKPEKDVFENMKAQTKYIGSRSARNRLFRAYDKGVDTGLARDFLIRYELETRKGTKTIARAIVASEPYGAIIRRYVDFPTVRAWCEIMATAPAQMTHRETVQSALEQDEAKSLSRWNWLQTSIPATVQKALSEDFRKFGIEPENNEEFQKFIRAIMKSFDKI